MRAREEFEEDSGVDWEIPTNTKTPQCGKAPDRREVGRARSEQTEDGCDTQGQVEAPFAAENVAAKAPEHSSSQKPNVLGKG